MSEDSREAALRRAEEILRGAEDPKLQLAAARLLVNAADRAAKLEIERSKLATPETEVSARDAWATVCDRVLGVDHSTPEPDPGDPRSTA